MKLKSLFALFFIFASSFAVAGGDDFEYGYYDSSTPEKIKTFYHDISTPAGRTHSDEEINTWLELMKGRMIMIKIDVLITTGNPTKVSVYHYTPTPPRKALPLVPEQAQPQPPSSTVPPMPKQAEPLPLPRSNPFMTPKKVKVVSLS